MAVTIRILAVLTVASWTSGAVAQQTARHVPPPEAVAHFKAGDAAYASGEFKKSIDEFRAAYAIDPAPLLLYNIAQAYRLSGQPDQALFIYRQYLNKDPRGNKRAEVEQKIAELEELIKKQESSKDGPPVGTADPTTAESPPPKERPAPPVASPPVAQPTPRKASPAGWVIGGTGLALGIVGVGLVGGSVSTEHSAKSASYLPTQRDLHSRALDLEAGGWALLGIGVAAVVTGVIVLVVQKRSGQRTYAEAR